MIKEIITTKQAIATLTIFIVSNNFLHNVHYYAKQDFWISFVFVIIFFMFILFAYSRIISLFPHENLLDIFRFLFGKVVGSIFYALLIIYAFTLAAFVTNHFTLFIQTITLPETPQYAYAICIVAVSMYIAKQGIESLGRWSLFSLPFIIGIFLLTVVLSVQLWNPDNLKPVFQSSVTVIAENTFDSISLLNQCVVFLLVFDTLKEPQKAKKIFYVSMAIGIAMIVITIFRNILVLGMRNNELLATASVSAVSVIQLKPFLERIEVIITIIFIICGIANVSVSLIGVCKGTAKLLKMESAQSLIVPIGVFLLMVSTNTFENIMQIFRYFPLYIYVAFPFQIIIPLAALITAEFKKNQIKAR